MSFEFPHEGRTFTCSVEPLRPSLSEAWWWLSISGERAGQRYAPFRREVGDTREGVQARIIAWYEGMIARKAEPPRPYWQRNRAPAEAVPAVVAAPVPMDAPTT